MSNTTNNKTPGQGKDQHLAELIEPAQLQWRDSNTPTSQTFDDVYYSSQNGLEETRYVFLDHNQLPQRWLELTDTPSNTFNIAETGFGTGLNFLATCQAWQEANLDEATLHFVSVEKHPLTPEDLAKAVSQWDELAPFAQLLIARYPPLVTGFHRIEFPEYRIKLTLIFDDAIKGFEKLDATIDAWYLDGFAPSKNPDMWQPELFDQISRLSKKNTTLATFTAAGIVRRGLANAGFEIQKHTGFGHKREMISGRKSADNRSPSHLPYQDAPWYSVDRSGIDNTATSSQKHFAVIGAGLAGAATAYALACRGHQVSVIEKEAAIAQQASGNPVGMTFTRLSPFDNPQNRFYQKAYLFAIERIKHLFAQSELVANQDYCLNGVFRFAYSDKEAREQQKLLESGLWPDRIAQPKTATECSDLSGVACKFPGLYLTEGGWLTPSDLCRLQLDHRHITLCLNQHVKALELNDQNRWKITTEQQTLSVDGVIFANSFGASQFPGLEFLPLRPVRGQITYVAAQDSTRDFKHALNYEGYITPAKGGMHCVGATFHPKESTTAQRQQDHDTNLQNLKHTLPDLYRALSIPEGDNGSAAEWPSHMGRVAFRCQSPDYLPMIGPIPNVEAFREDYSNLRKGFLKKDFPVGKYLPNIFVNVAHGSRGITSSIFAAEIIASYINQEPQLIDQEVLEAIHPARFAIRALKRNQL